MSDNAPEQVPQEDGIVDIFCECEVIDDPTNPLAQGDVFEWIEESDNAWQRYGIVVTADCDIAHGKNAGILSYVPLLRFSDYLALFYLPKQISRLLPQIEEDLIKSVHRLQAANNPAFPSPLTASVIANWVDAVGGGPVADVLGATGNERERLIKVIETRAALIACRSSVQISVHVDAICRARQYLKGTAFEVLKSSLWKDIQGHLKDLPGDALFVRALTKQLSSGFVAYLRFVRELPQTQVAIKQSEISTGARARRIGRMRPPYVYRLTQMLGIVFSSIGLPSAYEDARHTVVDLLQRDGHEVSGK